MSTSTMTRVTTIGLVLLLAACSGGREGSGRGGGYYLDDGPPSSPPSNLDAIPDAVPRIEPLASGSNRPYTVMGKRYTPDTTERPYRKRGIASWYGKKFHGNSTSNGERYDMYAMTAAHTTLPIPSYVRVTRVSNGRSVIVRVNDRGPFLHGRVIDLSYAAAHRLGIIGPGSGEVVVERITPDEIRTGSWKQNSWAARPTQRSTSIERAEPPEPMVVTQIARSSSPQTFTTAQSFVPAKQVFLQIGAFRDERNALVLANRATGSAPSQARVEIDRTVPQIYRVQVGPFANREAALQAVNPIYQSLGIMPSISVR